MADMTVTPDTFELALTLEAITLPGATHIESPAAFELGLFLSPVNSICSFPRIGRKPSRTFSDRPDPKAMLIGSTASGYPVLNKLFTFSGRTFTLEFRLITQEDKVIVLQFYEAHKDTTFPWYNDQDDTFYEVCFTKEPRCRIDGRKGLWRIQVELKQTTP